MAVVVRRTGLTPDVIRAWERRHGAVAPGRGAGGRRLYSEQEVERLALLKAVVDGGWTIGQVASRERRRAASSRGPGSGRAGPTVRARGTPPLPKAEPRSRGRNGRPRGVRSAGR